MLHITVREATDAEKLNIAEDAESLPEGVQVFDSTDWYAHFYMGLKDGDYVVLIQDDHSLLSWTNEGLVVVQKRGDGGFLKNASEF